MSKTADQWMNEEKLEAQVKYIGATARLGEFMQHSNDTADSQDPTCEITPATDSKKSIRNRFDAVSESVLNSHLAKIKRKAIEHLQSERFVEVVVGCLEDEMRETPHTIMRVPQSHRTPMTASPRLAETKPDRMKLKQLIVVTAGRAPITFMALILCLIPMAFRERARMKRRSRKAISSTPADSFWKPEKANLEARLPPTDASAEKAQFKMAGIFQSVQVLACSTRIQAPGSNMMWRTKQLCRWA